MRKIEVEVWDSIVGDSDYKKSKKFTSYNRAVSYAKKVYKEFVSKDDRYFLFIYIPKNDGHNDYLYREDWSSGKHDIWGDEKIY